MAAHSEQVDAEREGCHSVRAPAGDERADLGRVGVVGIVGAVLFLTADALLYLDLSGERDFVAITTGMPLWRIFLSGVLGVVASWFYAVASWQVYRALRPAGTRPAVIAFGALLATVAGMGVFHAVHACLGLVGRAARFAGADAPTTLLAATDFWTYISILTWSLSIPVLVFAVIFVWLVLAGRTLYPRWFVLFTPSFLFFAYTTVDGWAAEAFPGQVYVLISGGFLNGGFLVFFSLSTVLLLSPSLARERAARGGG